MITNEYIKIMARYNRWQNESLYSASETLGEDARRLGRGAFLGSIHNTLCHLVWGDMIWTSRFAGFEAPPKISTVDDTTTFIEDWQELKARRIALDKAICNWADGFKKGEINGEINWYSGVIKKDMSGPLWQILVHFFNHQTHHRGQVHAMITAAGGVPDDTDLILMSVG